MNGKRIFTWVLMLAVLLALGGTPVAAQDTPQVPEQFSQVADCQRLAEYQAWLAGGDGRAATQPDAGNAMAVSPFEQICDCQGVAVYQAWLAGYCDPG